MGISTIIFFLIICEQDVTNNSTQNSELLKIIQTEWDSFAGQYPNFPGGISVAVISGNTNYFATYKMGNNMTANTRFRVASITKFFTGAAILLLEQSGKLNIEDKIISQMPGRVETYIPTSNNYSIPFKDEITIKQVLEHRAGIFDINNSEIPSGLNVPYSWMSYLRYKMMQDPQHTFTTDELFDVISTNKLFYAKPGEEYHYSDMGYSLLSKIIERVSGESYIDFVTNNLLKSNNLNNSLLPYLGSD